MIFSFQDLLCNFSILRCKKKKHKENPCLYFLSESQPFIPNYTFIQLSIWSQVYNYEALFANILTVFFFFFFRSSYILGH